ncbi:thiamine pyrophosphate enzyme [Colletotrichum musicola]|uniref:Thiamine pyrophosphate enzyme n=1 Tax=Colletotrichum musicola TaxID=2175873 RepID=A0A8H6IVB4_9PEZI|nr:thiamine pyrophosphate enzyme [Colletotrichum musicola]
MSSSVTLAEYLFTCLHQLGVEAVHGVPGDYNLDLLDYVKPPGLLWVGNCNELNAAYAADEYGRFAQMHAHVTVAQESLWDPRTCAPQIDNILQQCLFHSRSVYIQVPADLVTTSLPADGLQRPIEIPVAGPDVGHDARDLVLAQIVERIHSSKKPVIIADGECRPLGIVAEVQALIDATQWPTWTTPFGKGLFDESRSNFHGIYKGDSNFPLA